jgi:hypothetical protein
MSLTYKYIFNVYNEDISWFSNDKDIMDNAIIYNKGNPLHIPNEILAKNVGLEPESFLNYIIDNYDNLPYVCVFSQGKIHDHLLYNEWGGTADTLRRLRDDAFVYGESPYVEITNDPYWTNDWNFNLGGHTDPDIYINGEVIKFIDWVKINIDSKVDVVTKFHPCCIFSVCSTKIYSRPKEYYQNLLNQLNWKTGITIYPGFMERSWYYMFNPTV